MRIRNINLTKKQKVVGLLLVSVIAIGGFVLLNREANQEVTELENVEKMEMYTLPGKEKIFLTGAIRPTQSKDFYYEADKGSSYEICVKNGDVVNKGEVLIKYKNEPALDEIKSIQSQIDSLKKQKSQQDGVVDEEGYPLYDVSAIDMEISTLNTKISELNKTVYSSVQAPFNGKIYIDENISENSLDDKMAQVILSLDSLEYEINGQVDEQNLLKIKKGDKVDILIFSTKENRPGYIKSISDRPSGSSGDVNGGMGAGSSLSNYDVKVGFENQEGLHNGFHAQATIALENKSFKIPSSAVIEENGETFVFKNDDGLLKKVIVKVEPGNDDSYLTVVSGLKDEESILRYPDETTLEGMAVIE